MSRLPPAPLLKRRLHLLPYLVRRGSGDQKRLGLSDDNSAIKASPEQTCQATPRLVSNFGSADLATRAGGEIFTGSRGLMPLYIDFLFDC